MRVLIAFDKFKGALGAAEACAVVAEVLRRARPSWELDVAPLADGGDGFCRLLTEAAGGVLREERVSATVFPASGRAGQRAVPLGWVELERLPAAARARLELPRGARRLALVEMAAVNGLAQLSPAQRDVWRSSTRGTGELIGRAAAAGADAVLLGVGGSATSDLGLGALAALGWRFEDRAGTPIEPLPSLWPRIARIAGTAPALPPLRIACDVQNPLLGPRGAAAVYGAQKGLKLEDLARFEADAERLARLACEHAGRELELVQQPGAGAAGGIAFGLAVGVGARLVAGFELVAEWLDLSARLERADLVISGEGRFDATSFAGKGPGTLAREATLRGRRCAIFAGSVEPSLAPERGLELLAISPAQLPLEAALRSTAEHLSRAVGNWLATRSSLDGDEFGAGRSSAGTSW
jgi:glycerate kinase